MLSSSCDCEEIRASRPIIVLEAGAELDGDCYEKTKTAMLIFIDAMYTMNIDNVYNIII